jgi:glycosyltransferase involved in cell wall biosynthesis
MATRRILFVNPYSGGSGRGIGGGGAERSLQSFIAALDRSRFEPILVYPLGGFGTDVGPSPLALEFCRAHGIQMHAVRMSVLKRFRSLADVIQQTRGFWPLVKQLRRLIDRERIDLVHVNSAQVPAATLAARGMGIPGVVHVRFLVEKPRLYRSVIARLTDGFADRIVCISNAVARMFLENGVAPERLAIIPNGIDPGLFSASSGEVLRTSLGLRRETPLIGTVGRLHPVKGIEHLLDAMPSILRTVPGAHCVVVGEAEHAGFDDYAAGLRERVRLHRLEARVHFTGFLADIAEVMRALDCFVLPAASPASPEPFGRVVVEAMAASRPVVATQAGGPAEIVVHGETGLLVPPAEPEALATAISKLLCDSDLSRRFGEAGRERMEEKYSLARHVAEMTKLFESLIEQGRPMLETEAAPTGQEGRHQYA